AGGGVQRHHLAKAGGGDDQSALVGQPAAGDRGRGLARGRQVHAPGGGAAGGHGGEPRLAVHGKDQPAANDGRGGDAVAAILGGADGDGKDQPLPAAQRDM